MKNPPEISHDSTPGFIRRRLYLHTVVVALFLLVMVSVSVWTGNTLTMITAIARFERTHTVSRVEAKASLLEYLDTRTAQAEASFYEKMAITQTYNKVFSDLLDMRRSKSDKDFAQIIENTFKEADHKSAVIITNRIKVLYWHPMIKEMVGYAAEANRAGEIIVAQMPLIMAASNKDQQQSIFKEIEKAEEDFISNERSFSKHCSEFANELVSFVDYVSIAMLLLSVGFTSFITHWIARSLFHQSVKHARALEKEVEKRTKAEEKLRQSRNILTYIIDSLPQSIFWKDRGSIYLGCNKSFVESTGLGSTDDIIGKSDSDLPWLPEETEAYVNDDREVMEKNTAKQHIIEPLQQADGTRILLDTTKIPLVDNSGYVYGVLGVFDDITERKRAEEALQESEAQYRALFNELNSGFGLHEVILDEAGVPCNYRFLAVNNTFKKMLGMTTEQIIGKTILDIVPLMPKSRIERFGNVALTGISDEFEDYSPLFNKHLEIRVYCPKQGQFAVIFMDITGRKHLEEQLRQSQKMEAIGQLAGGVAHDFNNILTVIIGYANLLEIGPSLNHNQQEAVRHIITSSERATQLTQGLLAFSRKQVLSIKKVNLNDIVNHVEKFLVRIIGEDIQLKSIHYGQILTVNVDSSQIEQVLINLVTNARDAMPKGGVLIIETGLQEIGATFEHAHGHAEPGRYASIVVSDTGIGMDDETRTRIFEPFFTTKEVGKGTGLGMAIVYGIVKQHGGIVNVYSEPGVGTTFKIYLPIVETAQDDQLEEKPLAMPRGGTETILVAEDDEAVSMLVTTVLTNFGYKVIQAKDGQDAVEKFADNRDNINIILMDMIMPKKNGKEAYSEISRLRPGVKVLFSSGYTADFIKSRGVSEEGIELMMKPVQPMELLRKVREMLDSK